MANLTLPGGMSRLSTESDPNPLESFVNETDSYLPPLQGHYPLPGKDVPATSFVDTDKTEPPSPDSSATSIDIVQTHAPSPKISLYNDKKRRSETVLSANPADPATCKNPVSKAPWKRKLFVARSGPTVFVDENGATIAADTYESNPEDMHHHEEDGVVNCPAQMVSSTFTEVGHMIQAESDSQKREEYLQRLMHLPNQRWNEIMGQTRISVDQLRDPDLGCDLLNKRPYPYFTIE